MSYHELNPSEVLFHLNELGYNNITPEQLKLFIKDLKKLIKYEERTAVASGTDGEIYSQYNDYHSGSNDYIEAQSQSSSLDDFQLGQLNNENYHNPSCDIFDMLHKTGTAASKAKVVPKRNKIITVEIKRVVSRNTHNQPYCTVVNPDAIESVAHSTSDSKGATDTQNIVSINKEDSSDRDISTIKSRVKSTISEREIKHSNGPASTRPKASFIRPQQKLKPKKCDPVALYQQYQAEWKRIKIPGTDNRASLRWAIRERMLGSSAR